MGSDMLSLFSLIIGVYLIYAAIVGRGKLYENEYLNCPREQYVKGLRILAAISGVLLTVSNLLEYLGVIAYGSPIAIALWALGFASLIVMMVYSSKKTDRKAAAAGHKTAASAEKKDYDPLRAAFVFDDDEDDAEEDQEKTVDHTRRQMQNAADEICLSAENTYISLRGMKYTLNQTNRSIQQLDRNIATVQKQVKLGMTGVNTLKSLQAQRESAVAGKASLTTQVEALTNTLAIQCGYTTGTQIETSDLPVVTAEQVTSIDYNKDLAEALKNSYAIYSKEYAMQTASDDYENNKTNTLYAYQAAKIDRDAQKESTTASFRKLYTDLQEKQTALAAADADLAQAKKTFTVSQVQYTRGMISKMAYTDALDTFTTAQETEVAARIDLLTAYNTYQWAKRGVITATT